MINQTIEQIIIQINIERTKSNSSTKTSSQSIQYHQQAHPIITNQLSENSQPQTQSSIKSSSPDQRSCRRSSNKNKQSFSQQNDKIYRKKWTHQEEQLLCNLIGRYGSDFTFLQTQFPNKTRKQLKKKYQQIHRNKRYLTKIQKIQELIIRERRKSFFDDEIMEICEQKKEEEMKYIMDSIRILANTVSCSNDIYEQSQRI